jgi:septal ring factor EnvC (AmiA/AmiB activator)
MRWIKTIALSVLALLSALAAIFAKTQNDRAKKAETEAASQKKALAHVTERAEGLKKAMGETAKTEEKANAEKKELADTPDSSLVSRANKLF